MFSSVWVNVLAATAMPTMITRKCSIWYVVYLGSLPLMHRDKHRKSGGVLWCLDIRRSARPTDAWLDWDLGNLGARLAPWTPGLLTTVGLVTRFRVDPRFLGRALNQTRSVVIFTSPVEGLNGVLILRFCWKRYCALTLLKANQHPWHLSGRRRCWSKGSESKTHPFSQ